MDFGGTAGGGAGVAAGDGFCAAAPAHNVSAANRVKRKRYVVLEDFS
jgi:hypothetical protein